MKVIFFDGVCGLCNGFVDFIMKIDKKKKFYFCPLQSTYAKNNLPSHLTLDLKTVVYQNDTHTLVKSDAVLAIFKEIGGLWKIASLMRLLPSFFRDFFYDMVASGRYQLFGKKDSCRIPSPEERARFIE